MRIGIFAKTYRVDIAGEIEEVLKWLRERGAEPLVDRRIIEDFDLSSAKGMVKERIPEQADALVVFGGDGTMLSVARLVEGNGCPILGVNLGSLGFLTEVTMEELYPALEMLLSGDYQVDERCMLKAEVRSDGHVKTYHALNDVVMNKAALARVISIDTFLDDDFIARFIADGVIVSTPTGSTAYSLSAGGPIIFPSVDTLLLTPICPHTLTNRPLALPTNREMRLILRSGEDVMLTVDGQVGETIKEGFEVRCGRSPFKVRLVRPDDRGFFDVLREKLKWGER